MAYPGNECIDYKPLFMHMELGCNELTSSVFLCSSISCRRNLSLSSLTFTNLCDSSALLLLVACLLAKPSLLASKRRFTGLLMCLNKLGMKFGTMGLLLLTPDTKCLLQIQVYSVGFQFCLLTAAIHLLQRSKSTGKR